MWKELKRVDFLVISATGQIGGETDIQITDVTSSVSTLQPEQSGAMFVTSEAKETRFRYFERGILS